jgi:hypothetical protein
VTARRPTTTVPAVVRAATYGAAVGDPSRWPSARHVYRAVLSLGVGLWRLDPAARAYAASLRAAASRRG